MTEKRKRTSVTHTSPDLDAIGYLWLLKRYIPVFVDAEIKLMPFSQIDQKILIAADSVGDMGGEYDPLDWRFDHHHLPGAESTDTCATKMLWKYLLYLEIDVVHLKPLVEVIHAGDLAKTDPCGIHVAFWGARLRKNQVTGQRLTDIEMIAIGFELLDRVAAWLKHKAEKQVELDEKTIWKSDDNLVCAIQNGSASLSFAAYEEGARIVVFEGEPFETKEGTSYPMGVSRAPGWNEPHLGDLVSLATPFPTFAMQQEFDLWFKHNGGFFAGRGSSKAPCYKKPQVKLIELAQIINKMWKR